MRHVLVISAQFLLPINVPEDVDVADVEDAYQRRWGALVAETLEPWTEPLQEQTGVTTDLEKLEDWGCECVALPTSGLQLRR